MSEQILIESSESRRLRIIKSAVKAGIDGQMKHHRIKRLVKNAMNYSGGSENPRVSANHAVKLVDYYLTEQCDKELQEQMDLERTRELL